MATEEQTVDLNTISHIDPSWPFQLFSELFSIPTLCVFVALSIQHYRKGFNCTFQKLVYITILNDMWTYYCSMFMIRWPQMGVFGFYEHISPSIIPPLFSYCLIISVCHQHLFILLTAMNRMHSLYSPFLFRDFWEPHLSKLLIFVFILPQPISIYIASRGAHYQKFARDSCFIYVDGMNGTPGQVVLFSTVCVCIITVTFNILSMVKLLWKSGSNQVTASHPNMKFHIYSLYTFVVETMFNITEFGIHIFPRGSVANIICMLSNNVLLDVFCLSSLWTWLSMSSEVRQLLWKSSIQIKTSS